MGLVSHAKAAVNAPGFYGRLKVVSGGLLWWGTNGVRLSTATGTHLLVRGNEIPTVLLEDGWTVVVQPSGLKVGRIGGRLVTVRRLAGCRQIGEGRAEDWRVAVADGNLYTIARASCVGRRPGQAQFLVRVRLGTETVHAIGRVSGGAISLAAAGHRLALSYEASGVRGRVRVEVLDSSSTRPLYSLTAPPKEEGRRNRYQETQIDSMGDVLVTSSFFIPPGPGSAFAWWANARTRVVHSLGRTANVAAALSEGRIAYATDRGPVQHIDVLNLTTRKTRTMVTFPGSARVLGVGLGKTRLAWAQQSDGYSAPVSFGKRSCVFSRPIGSPELAERSLSASGFPIAVKGVSVPPAAALLCPKA
jgi:hypothetical protein